MINNEFGSQSGKSLIEMLIVLVVTAVLVTFAVARYGAADKYMMRENLAREFKVNLERARFDSIKRRAEGATGDLSRVIITSATSFTVITDLNQDSKLTPGTESRVVNFREGIKFVGDLVYPITLSYDRRGYIYATNGVLIGGVPQPINPTFTICDRNCTAETANSSNSSNVSISPSGTVAMLKGGETQPNFASPSVTNVPVSQDVNPWVSTAGDDDVPSVEPPTTTPTPGVSPSVSPSISPTPSPSPTASVSPSPSGSATPSPTVSPTASPTPTVTPVPATPTPTPNACASGARPSSSGCVCYLPKTVRPNGKCQ